MNSNNFSDSTDLRGKHLRSVALHEISHAFVELHRSLGILITLNVNPHYPMQPHSKIWDGRIQVKVLNEELFRDSVNGWAGIMGEAIEEDRANALQVALEKYEHRRETMSNTDVELIESIPDSMRSQSAQDAFDSLIDSWSQIKHLHNRAVNFIEANQLDKLEFGWMKKNGWIGLEADK